MTDLTQILKDLSQLLPERFRVEIDDDSLDCAGFSVYVDGNWFWLVGMDVRPQVHIQCACQEEIEARGWHWEIDGDSFPDSGNRFWQACIWRPEDDTASGNSSSTDSAALAIETALRDAIRAEQTA